MKALFAKLNQPIAMILASIIGAVGVVLGGYFAIRAAQEPIRLSIVATQTAETKLTREATLASTQTAEALLVAVPTATPNIPTPTISSSPKPTFTSTIIPSNTPKPTSTPTPDPIAFQKGIAFPVWWHEHYCQSEYGLTAIQKIAELGADWVQLVPTWYQDHRNANEIKRLADKTTTDECLIQAIRTAHNNGLKVLLKPHVDSLDGYFRGEIAPSQPDAWFTSYEKMILHYTDIAHTNKVEIFVVGTELKSMSSVAHTEKWQVLISKVRQRYFNRLTYAANWDAYDQIKFWNNLDYVGIDAYFPLSNLDTPSREDILAGWQSYDDQLVVRHWADEVEAFVLAVDKPLIFTEIGYASQDGAARQPWRQDNSQQANPQLQAQLYEAALRTYWTQPYFSGLYWWFWDIQPDPLYEETGYMPKDLALQELQVWYEFEKSEMPPTPTLEATTLLTPTPAATIPPTQIPEVTTPSPPPVPTDTPSPQPSALGSDWESCTAEEWVAQTWEDSQGIESVEGSNEIANTGSCSLKLNARLQAGHSNYSKGETYIELPEPVSLIDRTISCWVYVPNENATGSQSAYNGAQVFVKDANPSSSKSEYGAWFNLEQVGWIKISLVPSTSTPSGGGYMDTGFDPNIIRIIGVKIAVNDQAPTTYSYNETFYVDSCSWSP